MNPPVIGDVRGPDAQGRLAGKRLPDGKACCGRWIG